jgi:hypothetical protein
MDKSGLNRHNRRALIKIKRTGRLTPVGRNRAVQRLLGTDAAHAAFVLRKTPIVPHASRTLRAQREADAAAKEASRI